jgi:N-acetylmuramoyl-L-alanine amidase
MVKTVFRRRDLFVVLSAAAAFLSLAVPAQARVRHSDAWARERFAVAERMREALNGRPAADRSRHEYQRVLNAYRSVYLGAPTSTKADPSVVAVAETLVEMGRHFGDDKILQAAIDQYKFLRQEYPGSKYRCDGLFTIGEIYKDDLNDADAARSAFEEFLRRYPNQRLADDARAAIGELDKQALAEKKQAIKAAKQAEKNSGDADAKDSGMDSGSAAGAPLKKDSDSRSKPAARVTAIRHWSTPDYSRVAIDVESDIKFSSQRIGSPARIYFDLRNTKLASTLVGKSIDVDDGFLKKVRLAQFAPGRTRIVLEVDNKATYDAFLLPNPYRLIVDIHSKDGRAKAGRESDQAKAQDREALSPTGTKTTQVYLDGQESVSPGGNEDAEVTTAAPSLAKDSAASTAKTAVVKKVVEADDEDENGDRPASAEKRTLAKTLVTHNAKAPAAGEESANSDSDDPYAGSEALDPGNLRKNIPGSVASAGFKKNYDLGVREAQPTASGERSLIRTLGLKIGKIVIDPGHGGHDTGTIGPNGLEEKDLVLDVGRRLGKLLETRLGAEVVYTRKDDTFIPLETRTAIANQARADLFVSIHANSSHDSDARGVETYYLNFTSSSEALEVAARENAVSEKSIFELQDLVKKIALKEKIEESREFAGDVQESLHSGLAAKSPAIRDRGVKKAPFIVLIGANMPSILAEISFVSNPVDERRLATAEYRERIAESLYRGIARYADGLSGVKVASKMEKAAGQ